ncbi:hypothetical protein SARC_00245 [Sphaeroforma arctica JP610]|uniref:Programmed cell death protein 5 n=1 Tax=Sphaeroforma arctica JP610 TaxID=667725 RepID=A0A0L0GFQ6_9EUKA|nr:hypothetical protein SARC_00245 [Sphaeroforma arctica JP610]KNC87674.1 hypothetical protein SARC_00245 [Sphaeroforma arctica JP610]|eukprot:XP_014161576.1 hypothetical protein SARC_00245 [Sphaeroforma arctica JP610]
MSSEGLPEGFSASAPPGVGGGGDAERQQQLREEMRQRQEMKSTMLSHLLTQDARARLGRIASVKQEKGQMIENALLNMFQSGQIKPKVTEEMLMSLIDQINEQSEKKQIKIHRRRVFSDDSDEEDDKDDSDDGW